VFETSLTMFPPHPALLYSNTMAQFDPRSPMCPLTPFRFVIPTPMRAHVGSRVRPPALQLPMAMGYPTSLLPTTTVVGHVTTSSSSSSSSGSSFSMSSACSSTSSSGPESCCSILSNSDCSLNPSSDGFKSAVRESPTAPTTAMTSASSVPHFASFYRPTFMPYMCAPVLPLVSTIPLPHINLQAAPALSRLADVAKVAKAVEVTVGGATSFAPLPSVPAQDGTSLNASPSSTIASSKARNDSPPRQSRGLVVKVEFSTSVSPCSQPSSTNSNSTSSGKFSLNTKSSSKLSSSMSSGSPSSDDEGQSTAFDFGIPDKGTSSTSSKDAESAAGQYAAICPNGLYLCKFPNCGETFTTRFSLKRHIKKHTGERPQVCPFPNCDSRFAERSTLKRHIRIHTGEKPYLCRFPNCMKSFADRTNVKRHQMIHTGVKPFTCCITDCSRTFSRKSYLRRHMSSFHGLPAVTDS